MWQEMAASLGAFEIHTLRVAFFCSGLLVAERVDFEDPSDGVVFGLEVFGRMRRVFGFGHGRLRLTVLKRRGSLK